MYSSLGECYLWIHYRKSNSSYFSIAGIGALIFGGMGFGIYAIFEKKVPEFLDFLSELGGGMGFRRSSSDPYSVGGDFSSDGEIKLAKMRNL